MGVIKQGILGGFQNKVGSVIGSNWKGIATMRARPLTVANPKTAKQIKVRKEFSNLVKTASQLNGTLIRPYWSRFAQRMTGANAFISANYGKMAGVVTSIPERLVFSQGKLDNLYDFSVAAGVGLDVNVTWNAGVLGTYGSSSDIVTVFVAYGTDVAGKNEVRAHYVGEGIREEAAFDIDRADLPRDFAEESDLYVIACVRREDGTIVSNSQAGRPL